jgi:hypothetical protein
LRAYVREPPVEEFSDGDLARHHTAAGLLLGDETGTFELCRALGALEAVPAALALVSNGVALIDDDGPMAGRSFADVASHLEELLRWTRRAGLGTP